MNTVNRTLVIILLLVAMLLCSITLAVPVRTLDAAARQATALADFIRQYERPTPAWIGRVAVCGLFALALDIVIVLLLIAELRRPRPKAIRVEKAAGGEVQVSVASIADRLKHEVDQLPSVLRSKSKVSGKRGGVVLELDVETAAGIDVPVKAEQIVETARQVVEEKMGLKMARPPKVNMRSVPYPRTPSVYVKPEESPPALLED
jgi:hypothetical protein